MSKKNYKFGTVLVCVCGYKASVKHPHITNYLGSCNGPWRKA